jgi:hypothetical protein
VQVDEAGQRLQASGVDRHGLRPGQPASALGDQAILDEEVGRRPVRERRPADEDRH